MMKYAFVLALIAAPGAALAQSAPADGPVSVEIVASGQVTVPANRFRFSATLTGKGEDDAAAAADLAANRAKLVQALGAMNIREAQATSGAPNSFMSLFASMAGRGKTTFTADLLSDDSSTEKPQSTASETMSFDAPTRAAVDSAKQLVEAQGGTVAEEVIALLDDYVTPTRRAKADAIVRARADAAAYAEALGLRRAALVKISERQDIVAGSMNFVTQLIGMIMPKGAQASDDVVVPVNLTIEFQLSR
jgi:uncharacterized protein YggE